MKQTSQKNRQYDAVIFDMDGLMFNTEELYYRTFNDTLDHYGASLTRPPYTACVGHPVEDNSRYAVGHYRLDTTPEAFCKTWMDRFDRAISDPAQIEMMPGFQDLLNHVRRRGYRLGIASSTQRPRMMVTLKNGLLAHLNEPCDLSDIFDVVLSGSDVTQTKPAPDIYLLAAERLRVPPAQCLVFEDSESGIRAAKAAGMTVIVVPNVFTAHQDHSAADVRLSCLADAVKDGYL